MRLCLDPSILFAYPEYKRTALARPTHSPWWTPNERAADRRAELPGGGSPAVDNSILPAPADYKWRHSGLPGTAVSSTQTKGNASPATGNLW